MKLIIVPGAADPEFAYKDVYDLLSNEASARGFSKVKVLNYKGHYSYDVDSYVDIYGNKSLFIDIFNKIEKEKEEYIVLCRSFGCMIFIELLKDSNLSFDFLKKVIFWGPSPYYLWYEYLFRQFNEDIFKEKKVRVSQSLFNELIPFELSIQDINDKIQSKIYITSGQEDSDYPKSFHKTLKEIKDNNKLKIKLPKRIKGLKHAVTEPNNEYFDLIFNV